MQHLALQLLEEAAANRSKLCCLNVGSIELENGMSGTLMNMALLVLHFVNRIGMRVQMRTKVPGKEQPRSCKDTSVSHHFAELQMKNCGDR